MFCIKIFFITETRGEQRDTQCDYINFKAYIMIFSFILVLFSFITDFYFCQKLHGSFQDLFCQKHF